MFRDYESQTQHIDKLNSTSKQTVMAWFNFEGVWMATFGHIFPLVRAFASKHDPNEPLFLSFPTLKILKDLLAFLAGSTTDFGMQINTWQTAGRFHLSTMPTHSTFEMSTWTLQWSSKVWCRVLVISSSSCAWSCTNLFGVGASTLS